MTDDRHPMIQDRPANLLDDPAYAVIPALPIGLELGTVPDYIKLSMLHLGGVQPLTAKMAEAAGFILEDRPSEGELDLYRREGTRFQMVSVVASIAAFREIDGHMMGIPYAISLVPANKRGTVLSVVDVDYVERIDLNVALQRMEPVYVGFNPFTGHWGGWGNIDVYLGAEPRQAFPDTLGLVTDAYYLQLGFDPETVLTANVGLGEGRPFFKYQRHRTRLMFSPFETFRARRVWGAESPIELFLLQGLLRKGFTPNLQMLLFEDGTAHPSIYDFWAQDLSDVPGLITEADMYFPEQRLAVFCDSSRHHRGRKAAQKDEAISERLRAAGIDSVRVPGPLIVRDLGAALDLVRERLV